LRRFDQRRSGGVKLGSADRANMAGFLLGDEIGQSVAFDCFGKRQH